MVVKAGATVKAEKMTGIYTKGRVTWNTKGLDGYAMAHPTVRSFRSEGKSYASLRRVK